MGAPVSGSRYGTSLSRSRARPAAAQAMLVIGTLNCLLGPGCAGRSPSADACNEHEVTHRYTTEDGGDVLVDRYCFPRSNVTREVIEHEIRRVEKEDADIRNMIEKESEPAARGELQRMLEEQQAEPLVFAGCVEGWSRVLVLPAGEGSVGDAFMVICQNDELGIDVALCCTSARAVPHITRRQLIAKIGREIAALPSEELAKYRSAAAPLYSQRGELQCGPVREFLGAFVFGPDSH